MSYSEIVIIVLLSLQIVDIMEHVLPLSFLFLHRVDKTWVEAKLFCQVIKLEILAKFICDNLELIIW